MKRALEAGLREWVEQLSMFLERDGLPRMAGRIFGWLLVCEPPEQSLEDLAAAVQGSKASMSTMTRLLAQGGLVERVRPPGARRDAFRIRPGQWQQLWRSRMEMIREVAELTGQGLLLLGRRPPPARARLDELHQQYRFMLQHLPALLDRLEAERAGPEGRRHEGAGGPRRKGSARRAG